MESWLGRAIGCTLVVFAVTSWLALLSWQLIDRPPLDIGAGNNLLGTYGALVSDMMIQTLGLTVVVVLICPMVWGLELLSGGQQLRHLRLKVATFPIAVLTLAGMASSLPSLPAWPLRSGVGGMLGDISHNLAAVAAHALGMPLAEPLAGLVLGVIGVCMLFVTLGISPRHVLGVATTTAKTTLDDVGSWLETARHASGAGSWSALPGMVLDRAAKTEPSSVRRSAASTAGQPPGPSSRNDHGLPTLRARLSTMAGAFGIELPMAEKHAPRRAAADNGIAKSTGAHTADRSAQALALELDPRRALGEPTAPVEDDHLDDGDDDDDARAVAERFAPASAKKRGKTGTKKTSGPRSLGRLPRLEAKRAAPRRETAYRAPSASLLRPTSPYQRQKLKSIEKAAYRKAEALDDVLVDFGIMGKIQAVEPGPVVTRFDFEPEQGTNISRIIGLADDFARALSTHSVRIAPSAGRTMIGIEVANDTRAEVRLREVLESDAFTANQAALPLAIGVGLDGEPIVIDLAEMPHLLIAGAAGSGKSVGINGLVLSLIFRHDPTHCRLLLLGPKTLDLTQYNGLPHLLAPVATDPQQAISALEWAADEMEERHKRMAKLQVSSIAAFNARIDEARTRGEQLVRKVQTGYDGDRAVYEQQALNSEPMPYLVIIIDEFAQLMTTTGRRVEAVIERLSPMAQAAGIHLIMSTQRPSADIVTGRIKAHVPTRLCYRVASKIESRAVLGEPGAEQLLGLGDMLLSIGRGQLMRAHGALVGEEEVDRVVEGLRAQDQPIDSTEITALLGMQSHADVANYAAPPHPPEAGQDDSSLQAYNAAVGVVLRDRKVSIRHLVTRLGIDESLASTLIARMEQAGIVGPVNRFGRRPILVTPPRSSATAC